MWDLALGFACFGRAELEDWLMMIDYRDLIEFGAVVLGTSA